MAAPVSSLATIGMRTESMSGIIHSLPAAVPAAAVPGSGLRDEKSSQASQFQPKMYFSSAIHAPQGEKPAAAGWQAAGVARCGVCFEAVDHVQPVRRISRGTMHTTRPAFGQGAQFPG
jgi:hypothetical protein